MGIPGMQNRFLKDRRFTTVSYEDCAPTMILVDLPAFSHSVPPTKQITEALGCLNLTKLRSVHVCADSGQGPLDLKFGERVSRLSDKISLALPAVYEHVNNSSEPPPTIEQLLDHCPRFYSVIRAINTGFTENIVSAIDEGVSKHSSDLVEVYTHGVGVNRLAANSLLRSEAEIRFLHDAIKDKTKNGDICAMSNDSDVILMCFTIAAFTNRRVFMVFPDNHKRYLCDPRCLFSGDSFDDPTPAQLVDATVTCGIIEALANGNDYYSQLQGNSIDPYFRVRKWIPETQLVLDTVFDEYGLAEHRRGLAQAEVPVWAAGCNWPVHVKNLCKLVLDLHKLSQNYLEKLRIDQFTDEELLAGAQWALQVLIGVSVIVCPTMSFSEINLVSNKGIGCSRAVGAAILHQPLWGALKTRLEDITDVHSLASRSYSRACDSLKQKGAYVNALRALPAGFKPPKLTLLAPLLDLELGADALALSATARAELARGRAIIQRPLTTKVLLAHNAKAERFEEQMEAFKRRETTKRPDRLVTTPAQFNALTSLVVPPATLAKIGAELRSLIPQDKIAYDYDYSYTLAGPKCKSKVTVEPRKPFRDATSLDLIYEMQPN